MSLLYVQNLGVHFQLEDQVVEAVRGVSFHIEKGETVALVGESGSGKSVSALSVMQLLPYPRASHPHGSVQFDGEEMLGAPQERLQQLRGDRIAMIFQEPMTSLNSLHTIEKQIGETLMLHRKMTRAQAREHTINLLQKVHLPDPETRLKSYPHQLSGGQRQRVMIAMALANEPDLLIADEPTTALDVTIQAQILKLLKSLQDEFGMAILLITHDLTIVRHVADRVYVMTQGKIVEEGDTARIFEQPQHTYTQKLLNAQPKGTATALNGSTPIVIEADNLKVWFPIQRGFLRRTIGHIKAVDGISVTIRAGHTVGVVGESGSGKTTLGLALLRLLSSQGPIEFNGQGIQGLPSKVLRPLRREMQIVFQDPFGSLSPRLSVFHIIAEGLRVHNMGGSEHKRRDLVAEIMDEVGLEPEMMDRFPHEFSGGQRQRIAIARAMVLRPRFVVLDEPTSALDMTVQSQIIDLLRRLQKDHDLAYLFISHDLRVVRALANELVVMKDGVVVEHGATETVFANPQTDYTRELITAAFDIDVVERNHT
ncbi:MAG: ABC transporter ATP-binding protein [Gemmatimonadetes bacterium]|nr:ABC transporter ATP-binding protein [Gemmatimonadota bacterium]MYB56658.1 ABC transporter ATP-binding protein [Gemmatimonadota bacterium]